MLSKGINRVIFSNNNSIISMELKNNVVNGKVIVYDKASGAMERSCDYVNDVPYGVYREYYKDKITYERIIN
jgi:antitoxin component YwqK of YwqJK toxin-antitoxin module